MLFGQPEAVLAVIFLAEIEIVLGSSPSTPVEKGVIPGPGPVTGTAMEPVVSPPLPAVRPLLAVLQPASRLKAAAHTHAAFTT
ncbi:MAG: hypothetical protein M5U33_09270 [Pseudorhodoplanes sp.]|nr:hypothetical protein [Pseudorhodoplanes sp.]